MSPMEWQKVCVTASATVSLKDLDDQLERIPSLSEDERSAIWLYAWASRENVARVAGLAA